MPVENIIVVVGTHLLSSGGITHRAIRVVEHPEYRQDGFGTYENDISLVQVESNFVFSSNVAAIQLGSTFVGGGINVVIAGFGIPDDTADVFDDNLQYLRTTTLTNSDSRSRMPYFMYDEITERTFCTFTVLGQGICRGVTGAAVVQGDLAVGIASFGQVGSRCGRLPDCHTRISSFRPWILSVIGEA
jgi:trypsin